MLDLRRIRTDPDEVAAGLARRGEDPEELAQVVRLDEAHRALETEATDLRREVKQLSKQVGQLRREGATDEAATVADKSRSLGERQHALAAEADELARQLRDRLLRIPNLPADDAPDGAGPQDNVELYRVGLAPEGFEDHQRVPHWESGPDLGILDLERAVRMSGSMFAMYRGLGATLNRALCQLALDTNADAFEEVRPPSVVLTDTMVATGHLPKFAEDAYHMAADELYAIPTAEVPLTSLARGEILAEDDLPARYMAYSPCFRREAGSAGRDTRGLLRLHEFDKVEILAYATEAQAGGLHEELLGRATRLIESLGLTYRVLDLCAGDLGGSAARTFDIEVYAPGVDAWLEVSSVSWFSDYQARRAEIRYRPADGSANQPVHTLNGSALAVPRVWAAIIETCRCPDGSIRFPDPVLPYLRGAVGVAADGTPLRSDT
ncbi:MAG: serine--tRNA ligase [Acidimicrobiia bacterium]|nr:serine--tRNA ligase [Acidimicrobiia bacterium]